MARRLIIVSNRLPISVHEENGALSLSRSSGGLATALASLFHQDSSLWVGWTGLRRHISRQEITQLNLPPHLVPVNLTDQEITHYYDQFSNGILWPLAHGLSATVPFTAKLWREVQKVTKRFADEIERTVQPKDAIWIHDYHLLLLPGELRRRGLKNRIGFFLHTPFPRPESIKDLPHIHELLQSLLSVNVLGVQVARDTKRLKETCALLGLNASKPVIKSFPIGVDFASFDSLNQTPTVKHMVDTFKRQVAGKTTIFSLSRLDYTKGITTQLQAFEILISDLSASEQVVYRLNIAPSRESMLEYRDLRQEIETLVTSINTRFGTKKWQPILYTYENIGPHEMAAWYQIADIHLNIPIADGMNLVAKEYIAARRKPGVLIITNTMGAAAQLREAIVINPKDNKAAARALKQALEMHKDEKAKRWKALRHTVKTAQVSDWAQDFLDRLTK